MTWNEKYKQAGSWDEATRIVMLASKSLPILPVELRTPTNFVKGCESKVWILLTSDNNKVRVEGFSEGKIVRGLIALIIEPIQNITLNDYEQFDFDQHLSELKLARYISPSRSNGVSGIVKMLKQYQEKM